MQEKEEDEDVTLIIDEKDVISSKSLLFWWKNMKKLAGVWTLLQERARENFERGVGEMKWENESCRWRKCDIYMWEEKGNGGGASHKGPSPPSTNIFFYKNKAQNE